MIEKYSRPKTLDEATKLLQQTDPQAVALAGGSMLIQNRIGNERLLLVDLQSLGIDKIVVGENTLRVGAMVKLNDLMVIQGISPSLLQSIYLETNNNIRNSATIGGTILSGGVACPLKSALLAMDAQLVWHPDQLRISLGDWLLKPTDFKKKILTEIQVQANNSLAVEYISRSPADKVALCSAVCVWRSGRVRIVISGASPNPVLAMDGSNLEGAEAAAINAYSHFFHLHTNSLYTKKMVALLTNRALDSIVKGAN